MDERVKAAGTVGHAEGRTALNTFDNALLDAGLGNVNLLKVSSILPPYVDVIVQPKHIRTGRLIPVAYSSVIGTETGDTIAAAVGYAITNDIHKNGVIMEYHGYCSKLYAEEMINQMLFDAFESRHQLINHMEIFAVEHKVKICGCAFAAIALYSHSDLYEEETK